MNGIKSYHLVKEHGSYALIIYLDELDVEFADEFGHISENKKERFNNEVKNHILSKFPRIHIPVCKVMLGSFLVASIPLMPQPVAAAETQQSQLVHEVVSGDTLWKISQKYGVSVDLLKNTNDLSSDQIMIGQKITIPDSSPAYYTVKSGDTLWRIANQYGITVTTLKSMNQLSTDTIYVGQKLQVTGAVNTAPTVHYMDYKVVSGDNTWKIAIKFGIPMPELLKANNLTESSTLSIGQILKIPVHVVPVMQTLGEKYGEKLDWWSQAQYVFPINQIATVVDFQSGKSFKVQRTIGANHSDTEPLTAADTEIAKGIWGGYSWNVRPILVLVNGHKIAASMSFMPHGIEYLPNNNFNGHFDIHFLNSTRHVDGLVDPIHQNAIKIAAGEIK